MDKKISSNKSSTNKMTTQSKNSIDKASNASINMKSKTSDNMNSKNSFTSNYNNTVVDCSASKSNSLVSQRERKDGPGGE